MLLYERGRLSLEARVAELLPQFGVDDRRKRSITVQMLLSHSSGLPAHARLYESARTRDEALSAVFKLPLRSEPGSRAEYSDIGFILLGEIIGKITGESLDVFCNREIFRRLAMKRTTFNPPLKWRSSIPPTRKNDFLSGRRIQSVVNDENARILGGVAGHAGLFADALDIAKFSECMLRGGAPILKPTTVARFTRRQPSPPDTSWALGWDTPSRPSQSGSLFSADSFGHLGYTGTSLWIDPGRRLAIALLTNRTWPDASSQEIKETRPAFHDAIVEALETS